MVTVEAVSRELNSNFSDFPLSFEDVGEIVKVRVLKRLESQDFARLATFIEKEFKGEWISNGKLSHFKVPKENPTSQKDMEVRGAIQLIESGLKKLKEVYK